jgi:hypothetical protein
MVFRKIIAVYYDKKNETRNFMLLLQCMGGRGSVVVKALRYKSEGPGIDSRCRRGFFRGI